LLDGTYAGDDSMIAPPSGLSGRSGSPITIRAFNDGRVLINGQFARSPVRLSGNSWFVLEGFNAKNGGPALTAHSVVSLSRGSDNNVLRRIAAWDASIAANSSIFGVHGSIGNLLEDVAGFGAGRKIFSNSQGGDNTTCRRCWGRWEGSTRQGPKHTFTLAYNSYGFVCENCIAFWSGESMPEDYTMISSADGSGDVPKSNFAVDQPYGLLSVDGIGLDDKCSNVRLRGSLALVRSSDVMPHNMIGGAVLVVGNTGCYEIRDTMSFIQPGGNTHVRGFDLRNGTGTSPKSAQEITSVRSSSAGDSLGSSWSVAGSSIGTTLPAVISPWTATSGGANLCKRWERGQVTNIPLWPWPMNQRIKDATASAGAYSGPCPGCVGGRLARRATDVTAIIESLLGEIPSTCR
jgi:hypothetical protein